MPLAKTIDDVLARLDKIIDQAIADEDRIGLFAALYRTMTARIKKGIAKKVFKDPKAMAALDVAFANRYFEAFDAYAAGSETTRSWKAAFDFAESGHGIFLQHLTLGINAHINLDLGIAVARTIAPKDLAAFKPDFDAINDILADLVDPVKAVIEEHSEMMDLVDRVAGGADDMIMNFSMKTARTVAWLNAEALAPMNLAQQKRHIDQIDRATAVLAQTIAAPSALDTLTPHLIGIIRHFECDDVDNVITGLRNL